MHLHTWLAYLAASCLIALSPGSGAVLSISHGLRYGVRGAGASIAGLQLGLVGITLIAGVGVGAVLLTSATAFTVVKLLGSGYLVWLGWRQWNQPAQDGPGLLGAAAKPDGTDRAPAALSRRQRFLTGLFTNLTNPKGIVFMVAVLPQFISPSQSLLVQIAVLIATTVSVDSLVMHGYAFTGSRLARVLSSARAQRIQNRFFGGVLMSMGISLLLVRRTAN